MSVFKLFGTDPSAESNGVWIKYDDVKFLVARMGGANARYAELLKIKIRPVKHQIERDTLPAEESERITAEVFAQACVKAVEVKIDGKWVPGVPQKSGEPLPFTTPNVVALLLALPDLARDLRVCASDGAKYQDAEEEDDAKNS